MHVEFWVPLPKSNHMPSSHEFSNKIGLDILVKVSHDCCSRTDGCCQSAIPSWYSISSRSTSALTGQSCDKPCSINNEKLEANNLFSVDDIFL